MDIELAQILICGDSRKLHGGCEGMLKSFLLFCFEMGDPLEAHPHSVSHIQGL